MEQDSRPHKPSPAVLRRVRYTIKPLRALDSDVHCVQLESGTGYTRETHPGIICDTISSQLLGSLAILRIRGCGALSCALERKPSPVPGEGEWAR